VKRTLVRARTSTYLGPGADQPAGATSCTRVIHSTPVKDRCRPRHQAGPRCGQPPRQRPAGTPRRTFGRRPRVRPKKTKEIASSPRHPAVPRTPSGHHCKQDLTDPDHSSRSTNKTEKPRPTKQMEDARLETRKQKTGKTNGKRPRRKNV